VGQRIEPKEIIIFVDAFDKEPYTQWINKLKDKTGAQRIKSRLRRLEAGLYGDCSPVGDGVLLCGGDKNTQEQDIKTAKQYWKEYKDNG
jgi:putative component of toxin-antitoxin plasmid stabilization module